MNYRILVPSGIGDFSWLWSKLVTTNHNYHIEYLGGYPNRLHAFLDLLPRDRVLSFKPNLDYCTKWNESGELVCFPRHSFDVRPIRKARYLSDLSESELVFIECNTYVEHGFSLKNWWKDEIPGTDYHYEMRGTLSKCVQSNYFIVNFSSYGTKKAWGYYEITEAADIVRFIFNLTGWMPVFIGGEYDDFTRDIHKHLIGCKDVPCLSLVGRTPELVEVVALLQQSKLYFGACSGLMVLSNIFNVPVITYYPPFEKPPGWHLSGTWHDPSVPHLGLFWEGVINDRLQITDFFEKACGINS